MKTNGKFYQWKREDAGVDVMEKDWDNLLILDACRPDILRDYAPKRWDVQTRLSKATVSPEFMDAHFTGRTHHDTVFLSANPFTYDIPEFTFHARKNLLETRWNDEYETVLPEVMAEEVLTTVQDFPNKRVVAHFIQPHIPFLGEKWQDLNQYVGIAHYRNDGGEASGYNVWARKMYIGDVSHDRLIQAFRANHEITVEAIKPLLQDLPGKTVITADHANLLGERTYPIPVRIYGHPPKFPKQELIEIPWVTFEGEERRDITVDSPTVQAPVSDAEAVSQKLRALGYKGK